LLGVIATVAYYHLRSLRAPQGPVVHVENGFEFSAHGPYKTVAGLEMIGLRSFCTPRLRATLLEKSSLSLMAIGGVPG
jgi:hypothetical protein